MDKYNLGTVQQGISKTVLYDGNISSAGTYALSDSVYNYKLIIVEHCYGDGRKLYKQSNVIVGIYNDIYSYMICHGNESYSNSSVFHFSNDGNNIVVDFDNGEHITKIIGIN